MSPILHIHASAVTLFEAAAKRVIELGNEAIAQRGVFHLALAGGQTPRALYRCLGAPPMRQQLKWRGVQLWFGDERCVPPDHPDSNYRMAREELLERLPLEPGQFHRMEGELEPELAAQRYREALTHLPQVGGLPIFDLILLGLGADGHIASLFPDTPARQREEFTVTPLHSSLHRYWRLTLTLPVLNRARHLLLLVSGEKKADIVRHIFAAPAAARPLPAQLLQPAAGALEWYLDRDAALLLPAGSGQ
ncbi:MAG TPA: 6-phosphogluconolactonase [Gammaproteobacteria bacterium]